MSRQGSQNDVFGLDDYDQPTEPERLILPAQPPSPYSYPMDSHLAGPVSWPGASYNAPQYPVLPPAPQGNSAQQAYQPARSRSYRHTRIPALVGLLFVLIQLILLGRVLCMFFNVTATAPWFSLLATVSNLLVWPAQQVALNIRFAPLEGTQLLIYLEFLLIILVYGLFARLLVRFLKLFL